MKLDGEKLLAKLEKAKSNHIRDKLVSIRMEDYAEAAMYHAGECTIDNVINAIKSGDYTIEN